MSFQQNKSQNCFQVSQCSLMKRSFKDHQMIPMPVPNKLCLLSSMRVPTTNDVSHLPAFLSQLSVLSGLTSMDHSLGVKGQASSTPKVSHHAFTLLAFELATSTNQNSSATTALKAIAKMQASPDSNATCNAFGTLAHEHQPLNRTHPIF
jgi:hypothetical protein